MTPKSIPKNSSRQSSAAAEFGDQLFLIAPFEHSGNEIGGRYVVAIWALINTEHTGLLNFRQRFLESIIQNSKLVLTIARC